MDLERTIRRFRRTAVRWMWAVILFVPRTVSWCLSATGHAIKALVGTPLLPLPGAWPAHAHRGRPVRLSGHRRRVGTPGSACRNLQAGREELRWPLATSKRPSCTIGVSSNSMLPIATPCSNWPEPPRRRRTIRRLAALMEQLAPENFNDPDYRPGPLPGPPAHRAKLHLGHAAASSAQHLELSKQHFRAALAAASQMIPWPTPDLVRCISCMGLYEPVDGAPRTDIALEAANCAAAAREGSCPPCHGDLDVKGMRLGAQKNEERARYWGDKAQEHYRPAADCRPS